MVSRWSVLALKYFEQEKIDCVEVEETNPSATFTANLTYMEFCNNLTQFEHENVQELALTVFRQSYNFLYTFSGCGNETAIYKTYEGRLSMENSKGTVNRLHLKISLLCRISE